MDFDKIIQLIETVSNSSLSSFTLEEGNMKLTLETNRTVQAIPQNFVASPVSLEQNNSNNSTIEKKEEKVIKSPLVGTFYTSSSPDTDAFVKIGDTVKKGQIIGIIEAMKLMNEIECDQDGIIAEILVENEMMVEYGQPLFRLK